MNVTKVKTAICFVVMCTLLVGCENASQQMSSDRGQSAGAESGAENGATPKLSLHKPKTLTAAVERLQQIHRSLLGDGDFPAPTTIQYVEVIHGTGASGHSHYYTAADFEATGGADDHDHDHDHGHDDHGHDDHDHAGERHREEGEVIKRRSLEVDLRTELTDIVRWMPDIAAKSDLNESQWNFVKSISDQLTAIIDGAAADATDDSSFRQAWRLKTEKIEPMLGELQTRAGASK